MLYEYPFVSSLCVCICTSLEQAWELSEKMQISTEKKKIGGKEIGDTKQQHTHTPNKKKKSTDFISAPNTHETIGECSHMAMTYLSQL